MPKLFRVILPVSDIERAAAFYAQLFGIPGERVSPGRHYFDRGGTILACYDPAADGDGREDGWTFHPKQYLYFAVPDLEAILDTALVAMQWRERMFYARDPLGSRICCVDERTL